MEALRGGGVIVTLHSQLPHWNEVGVRHHPPTALSPGNTRYVLYSELVGPQRRSGRARKIVCVTPTFLLMTVFHNLICLELLAALLKKIRSGT
jgi:hypothetical protein